MEKKITQKQCFEEIINVLNGEQPTIPTDEVIDFLNGRIELLNKKSSNKKPTKTQEANEALKDVILQVLEDMGRPATASEIIADDRIGKDISNQKMTSLLTQLKKAGAVVRTEEKGKAVFAVV